MPTAINIRLSTVILSILLQTISLSATPPNPETVGSPPPETPHQTQISPQETLYQITLPGINGKKIALDLFKNNPILFVNVASKCGFTRQYKGLETLHNRYKKKGLIIIGIPSNDFYQEPGTEKDIQHFCKKNYGVTFLMTQKLSVKKGKQQHALFQTLTQLVPDKHIPSPAWNFSKYLVAPNATDINYYRSSVKPLDRRVLNAIKTMLPKVDQPTSNPRSK